MENLNAETIKDKLKSHIISLKETQGWIKSGSTKDWINVKFIEEILTLIKSQEQRIKELTEENERLRARHTVDEKYKYCNLVGDTLIYNKTLEDYNELRADFKANGVRKFAERLIAEIENTPNANEFFITAWRIKIDQIAKEMLEGEK